MALIQPTDTPELWRVEAATETVSGETQISDATGAGNASTVISGAGEVEFMAAAVAAVGTFDALPAAGTPLLRGEIYSYGAGLLYMVRQDHTRTEHDPETVPALFIRYREDASGPMDWIAGEQVSVGTLRVYGGDTYRCIQAHVTQSDWTPPAVPALWAIVVPSGPGEWAVGVAYSIGDEVTYNGANYRCIQAHTSQAGWMPPAVPALWQAL